MKLKNAIFILLLIFTLIPLYIFGFFMICANNRNIEKIMEENLEAVSGLQILDINNFCEARKANMEIIAGYEIVHDAIKDSLNGKQEMDSKQKEYLQNILAERRAYNNFIESVSVINRDYFVVASSEEYDESILSDLQKAKKENLECEFMISNIVERKKGDETINVLIARQRVEENGELIGYIVEEIKPSYFDRNRTETNFSNGTIYILDGEDRVITAGTTEEERQGYVTSAAERENYTKAWNKVDLEKEPSGNIRYSVDGVEYITYYSTIDYTDWNIKVTVNLSKYRNSKEAYRLLLGMSLIVVSLLLLVSNYYVTKRLTKPIEKISVTLKKIKDEQDYSLRIENGRNDEMGALTGKINSLLEYIEKEDMQEKERQRYLKRKAERDPLTGVKNKKAVEETLQDMLIRAADNKGKAAIGFLDIDDFKDYNTKYGHQEGDRVIQFVAAVIENKIKGIVGRNGGDEFVFGIENVESAAQVEYMISELLNNLNRGIYNKKLKECMPVPCSVGIVVATGSKLHYSSMISSADEAMYRAKERGKNTYEIICLDEEG